MFPSVTNGQMPFCETYQKKAARKETRHPSKSQSSTGHIVVPMEVVKNNERQKRNRHGYQLKENHLNSMEMSQKLPGALVDEDDTLGSLKKLSKKKYFKSSPPHECNKSIVIAEEPAIPTCSIHSNRQTLSRKMRGWIKSQNFCRKAKHDSDHFKIAPHQEATLSKPSLKFPGNKIENLPSNLEEFISRAVLMATAEQITKKMDVAVIKHATEKMEVEAIKSEKENACETRHTSSANSSGNDISNEHNDRMVGISMENATALVVSGRLAVIYELDEENQRITY